MRGNTAGENLNRDLEVDPLRDGLRQAALPGFPAASFDGQGSGIRYHTDARMQMLATSSQLLRNSRSRELVSPQFVIDPTDQLVAGFVLLAAEGGRGNLREDRHGREMTGDFRESAVVYVPYITRAAVDRFIIGSVGAALRDCEEILASSPEEHQAGIDSLRLASAVSSAEGLAAVVTIYTRMEAALANGARWNLSELESILAKARASLVMPSPSEDASIEQLVLERTLKDFALYQVARHGMMRQNLIRVAARKEIRQGEETVSYSRYHDALSAATRLGILIWDRMAIMTTDGPVNDPVVVGNIEASHERFSFDASRHEQRFRSLFRTFQELVNFDVDPSDGAIGICDSRPFLLAGHRAIAMTVHHGGYLGAQSDFSYSMLVEANPRDGAGNRTPGYLTTSDGVASASRDHPVLLRIASQDDQPLVLDSPLISAAALRAEWEECLAMSSINADSVTGGPSRGGHLGKMFNRLAQNIDKELRAKGYLEWETEHISPRIESIRMIDTPEVVPPGVPLNAARFELKTSHAAVEGGEDLIISTIGWLGLHPTYRHAVVYSPEIQHSGLPSRA